MKIRALIFFILILAGTTYGQSPTNSKSIRVEFNHNVEFGGFVFFLGSLGEQYENNDDLTANGVKKKDWYAYNLSLYKKYKSFKNDKDLTTAVQYLERLEGSDLIRLLIRVDDFPKAKLLVEIRDQDLLAFSINRDPAEARENASEFIEALNRFYTTVNFDEYFHGSKRYYEQAHQEITDGLPSDEFIPAMEKFYRKEFDSYTLLPSLTLPNGMAFGVSYVANGKTKIFNSFGAFAVQHIPDGAMGFADEKHLRELSTHEFGHSFSNPAVQQLPARLFDETKILYEPIREAMDNQGYNLWKSCVYEHFVRAGEVVIAKNLGLRKDAAQLEKQYIENRKFIYLRDIIQILEMYDDDRKITYQEAVNKAMEKLKVMAAKLPQPKEAKFSKNPDDIKIHTEDIHSFWKVFDETYPDLNGSAFQERYIKTGSIGLQNFLQNRIESGSNLSKTVKENLSYYQAIRASSLSIEKRTQALYNSFHSLKQLYPDAVFPDVYFVIGAKNTGGTSFNEGVIIGAEMFGEEKDGFKPRLNIEHLDGVVTHELFHFQQNYPLDQSLLAQCIREGSANFLTSLMKGIHEASNANEYGEKHKEELWKEFLTTMHKTNWTNWLYYSKDKSRPRDLGYWMGYKITKAYYDRAEDKSKAVKEILNIKDFKIFLMESGYQGE